MHAPAPLGRVFGVALWSAVRSSNWKVGNGNGVGTRTARGRPLPVGAASRPRRHGNRPACRRRVPRHARWRWRCSMHLRTCRTTRSAHAARRAARPGSPTPHGRGVRRGRGRELALHRDGVPHPHRTPSISRPPGPASHRSDRPRQGARGGRRRRPGRRRIRPDATAPRAGLNPPRTSPGAHPTHNALTLVVFCLLLSTYGSRQRRTVLRETGTFP